MTIILMKLHTGSPADRERDSEDLQRSITEFWMVGRYARYVSAAAGKGCAGEGCVCVVCSFSGV